MDNWPRALIFAVNAPPLPSAAAQVLERLISGHEKYFEFIFQEDDIKRSGTGYYIVKINSLFNQIFKLPFFWRFEQYAWYQAAIQEGMRQTAQSKYDVIIACHPNMAFTLAAAKVAKIKGLPLVVYLLDLFSESRVNPVEKVWANITEKKLLKQTSFVICLTQGLQKHYKRKHNINSVLIPHIVTDSEVCKAVENKPSIVVGSPITITYAGGVYQARLDALIAVKQAIDQMNAQGHPAKLIILGRNDPVKLNAWGLGGPYVNVNFVKDRTEFMDTLRRSDLLLSTIAFESAYPLQDQTCFPTKTFDYFLAGKPIMVVAPEINDYVTYMKHGSAALIINTLEPKKIAEQICDLATDLALRKKFVDSGLMKLDAHNQKTLQVILNEVLNQSLKSSFPFSNATPESNTNSLKERVC